MNVPTDSRTKMPQWCREMYPCDESNFPVHNSPYEYDLRLQVSISMLDESKVAAVVGSREGGSQTVQLWE
jgi:hypothetical protein